MCCVELPAPEFGDIQACGERYLQWLLTLRQQRPLHWLCQRRLAGRLTHTQTHTTSELQLCYVH